nr:hypothetical protein [Nocardioides alcanivorans]
MAARGSTAQVLGRVTLVTGPEEYLNERTVRQVREATIAQDPEAEFSETVGGDLSPASMGELSAPSLFSATRCVVVRALENIGSEAVEGLLAYAGAPSDDVALVLMHSGGQKGSGTLNKLRKLATVDEVKSAALRASEFPRFVQNEARQLGPAWTTRRPHSWSRPWDRISGPWQLRSTNSSTTSRVSRSTPSGSSAISEDVPRRSRSRSRMLPSTADAPSHSRSCGGPSTAARRRC